MTDAPIIYRTKLDALLPRDASAMTARKPLPDATSRQRKPLGLAPVPGDIDEPEPSRQDRYVAEAGVSFLDNHTREQLDAPATVELVLATCDAAASMTEGVHQKAVEKFARVDKELARVELENAQLRASVAALTAKVDTLTFISERLRVENAGPVGPQGPMGRDGHDGPPGAKGERGERGDTGRAAPTIAAWRLDEQAFTATPLMSDGRSGAVLHARPLSRRSPMRSTTQTTWRRLTRLEPLAKPLSKRRRPFVRAGRPAEAVARGRAHEGPAHPFARRSITNWAAEVRK